MPQPPKTSEHGIKDAMEAKGDWFVPVLISDLRQTADKGAEAIVHPRYFFLIAIHSSG